MAEPCSLRKSGGEFRVVESTPLRLSSPRSCATSILIPRASALVVLTWFLLSSASESRAQDLLWKWNQYGGVAAWGGDVDADGFADIVTTSGNTIYALSGKIGTSLYQFAGGWSDSSGAGIGDFDGDGFGDIVVGAPGDGYYVSAHVAVYSGQSGAQLFWDQPGYNRWFGIRVAGAGDVDGDGLADVLVCEGSQPYNDIVHLYAAGSHYGFLVGRSNVYIGPTAASAGDVNGDGQGDFLIGAPGYPSGGTTAGYVEVQTLPQGTRLYSFLGEAVGDLFGAGIAGGGDVNADGFDDVIVGAPFNSAGGAQAGRAYVYSGRDGSLLFTWTGEAASDFGWTVAMPGDLDHDGFADCAVAAINYSLYGRVYVYSGRTGALYFTIDGDSTLANPMIASVSDVNADGFVDIAVGGIDTASSTPVVAVYSGAIAPVVSSVTPNRTRYDTPASVTVTGRHFSLGTQTDVLFGSALASNVTVVDDSTITCATPTGDRGPVAVTVANNVGSGTLDNGFAYTPAVLIDGDPVPGGHISVRYLCDSFNGILAIWGLPPPVSVPTPPFVGDLCILPNYILFIIPPGIWPFDEFDLSGDIPNDPSLSGARILLQALVGPSFSHPKDAAWTNCATLTIQ